MWSPRIAVVVQQQIDSQIAGVCFSLNPVTNDYDEAVIDANWGLGTSVVERRTSPDRFVVNKIERKVVEETLGGKQVSIWLRPEGGIIERKGYCSAERTLRDGQMGELTDVISRVEALYGRPVDIEWAYADGALYVLQARPLTTYVPLPPEMITQPGERRRLYLDAALSKGLTINKPISPLGLDLMEGMFSTILESWIGALKHNATPDEALFFCASGRMYMNFSNLMWLVSPKILSKSSAPTDSRMEEMLSGVGAKHIAPSPGRRG